MSDPIVLYIFIYTPFFFFFPVPYRFPALHDICMYTKRRSHMPSIACTGPDERVLPGQECKGGGGRAQSAPPALPHEPLL
jgi:hypothetical protein